VPKKLKKISLLNDQNLKVFKICFI